MKNFYINNMKRLFTASLVTLIVFADASVLPMDLANYPQ